MKDVSYYSLKPSEPSGGFSRANFGGFHVPPEVCVGIGDPFPRIRTLFP